LTTNDKLDSLARLKKQAEAGGGKERTERQQAQGKLTARKRLELVLDPGSFNGLGTLISHRTTDFGLAEQKYLGDAVISGSGKIDGRLVFIYSQDFTVLGGSISEVAGQKVCQAMDMALSSGVPIIAIYDSGGARIQEGVASLSGVGEMLLGNTMCSGVIPQLSVVVGPSAGGAVYCPAITDFVFMVKGISQMYITGPDVVKAVTGEEISHQELGGAEVHAQKSGVAHFIADSEAECFEAVRRLLSFLPQSNKAPLPKVEAGDNPERTDENLLGLIPDDSKKAYDMMKLIISVVDNGDFMEVHQHFAPNIIVGFARLNGKSVGVVAQQPACLAGVIDIDASVKAARFVRFCDGFNIPLVSFVDVPGFMPGAAQEHHGIIRHGAKLIYAYAEATVPKVTVITRKAYGGAYIVMSSKAEGAVNIIFRKAISESAQSEETRQKLVSEYRDKFDNPYEAAARGYIDDVIDPRQTRPKLIKALEMLKNKTQSNPPRKHGNIPL
jgi:propionyl-CoA carboxylase beta chain